MSSGSENDPTDEELRAFVAGLLANLDNVFQDAEVVDQAITSQRSLWVALYHASADLSAPVISD